MLKHPQLKSESHHPGQTIKPKRKPRYPEKEYIDRLLQVHALYIRFGNLQGVADHLHLTRERVRQLLQRGHAHKLFQFTSTRRHVLEHLCQRISKEEIIREIRNGANISGLRYKFNIDRYDCLKLLKAYHIDAQGLSTGARYRGFASMDKKRQVMIASAGGKAAHAKGTAHRWTREEARTAGKKGGKR